MFILNSQSKRNISKTKKQRNHSQLKDQEHSSNSATMNQASSVLIDSSFKKKMRILKELRAINRNAKYSKKELETIKRNHEKL